MRPPTHYPPRRNNAPAENVGRYAFPALLVGNIALAFGPLFVRMATADAGIGPIAAGFWRVALAVPVLLLLTRVTRQPIGRLSPKLWLILAVSGVFFAGDLAAWHLGIMRTTMANSTLFGNSTSLIFPIYGFIIARALPTRSQLVALVLAVVGCALLLGRSYQLSAENMVGDLLCLLAGLLYAAYLIAIERARTVLLPWPVLALSSIACVAPMLVMALVAGESVIPTDWTAPVALALVSQLLGQGLLVYAVGHLRPLVVGLTLLCQPVVAATIGFIGYGETVGALDVVGAAIIGTAIVMARQRRPRPIAQSVPTP